jgi:hypothetical protein
MHDAVRDGVITRPARIFAPGFGAGAVAGYVVMRLDPAVVDLQTPAMNVAGRPADAAEPADRPWASDDVHVAFG